MEDTREWLVGEALRADAAGDLVGAARIAEQVVLQASRRADVWRQVEALLLLARVSRHRRDATSLRRARDAAGVAVQVAGLPHLRADQALSTRAGLERAACLVESGRLDEGFAMAADVRDDDEAAHAGWAWTSMGQARLAQGRTREAIAALSNAVAEFERAPVRRRVFASRVRLATALTKAGHLEHGADILEADLEHWRTSGRPRLQAEHHLALAESLRQRGRTAPARALLATVADLLGACTGMEAVVVRLHQQQASCDLDWYQSGTARRHVVAAERLRASLREDAGSHRLVPAVPRPAAVLTLGSWTPHRSGGLHRDLEERALELSDAMASDARDAEAPESVLLGSAMLATDAQVRGLVARARRSRTLDDGAIDDLLARLESLAAVPGAERQEVKLLVRMGELLRSLDRPRLVDAERLLRRALVRLARLPGMGLWQARSKVGLAMVLRDDGRFEEALPHAIGGVEVLDAERFEMDARRLRSTWGKHHNDAFDCAIDLAHRCGRTDIAADLIVFSRAAGVVTGSVTRLVPVPRLHYIDGTISTLGRGEGCLFA